MQHISALSALSALSAQSEFRSRSTTPDLFNDPIEKTKFSPAKHVRSSMSPVQEISVPPKNSGTTMKSFLENVSTAKPQPPPHFSYDENLAAEAKAILYNFQCNPIELDDPTQRRPTGEYIQDNGNGLNPMPWISRLNQEPDKLVGKRKRVCISPVDWTEESPNNKKRTMYDSHAALDETEPVPQKETDPVPLDETEPVHDGIPDEIPSNIPLSDTRSVLSSPKPHIHSMAILYQKDNHPFETTRSESKTINPIPKKSQLSLDSSQFIQSFWDTLSSIPFTIQSQLDLMDNSSHMGQSVSYCFAMGRLYKATHWLESSWNTMAPLFGQQKRTVFLSESIHQSMISRIGSFAWRSIQNSIESPTNFEQAARMTNASRPF